MFTRLLLLVALFGHINLNNAVLQCCPEPNIVENRKCRDGSNVTVLSCKHRHLAAPTLKIPESFKIDENEDLIITNLIDQEIYKIERNMFCMTRNPTNTSDLAYLCYTNQAPSQTRKRVIYYIKIFCGFITFIFSLLTFIIYLFTKDLHDIEGKCVLNFTAGLCVEHFTVMLLPILQSLGKVVCTTSAFVYYTSLLFHFTWLSVISFHIWRLTNPIFRAQIKWFFMYCLYGFGVPFLILATSLVFHHLQQEDEKESNGGDCLTLGSIAILVYFYGPLIFITVMCVIPLLFTAKRLWINIDRRETAPCVQRLRAKCRLFGLLTALMGSVLVFDILMYLFQGVNNTLEYILDILDCRNLAVGLSVFMLLVVYRNKVLIALAKRGLCCIKFPDKWAKLVDDEKDEKDNDEATLTPFANT